MRSTKKKPPAATAVTGGPKFSFHATAKLILKSGGTVPVLLSVDSHDEIMRGCVKVEGDFSNVPVLALHGGFYVEIFGTRFKPVVLDWSAEHKRLVVLAGPAFRAIARIFPSLAN